MNKAEFIKNAIDANGFQLGGASATSAGYVNPDIWNRNLLDFQTQNLVVAPLGKRYDDLLNVPGEVLNVSVDAEPTAAGAIVESDDVSITAMTFTQVVFTPTEYGAAYQVSDKEARRSFFDLMGNMTKKLGYKLALKKETLVISTVTTGAGHAVVANGVASSAIASSDTIDEDDIVNAMTLLRSSKYTPKDLVVAVEQLGDLMKLSTFKQAYAYGGREVILGGKLGVIYGLNVMWTQGITPAASKAKALLLGVTGSGEESFGICQKSNPAISTQYFARGRYTDVVAVEEYQVQVLHASAIATIETYAA
jgi:N4-gp56 family major capsid protein